MAACAGLPLGPSRRVCGRWPAALTVDDGAAWAAVRAGLAWAAESEFLAADWCRLPAAGGRGGASPVWLVPDRFVVFAGGVEAMAHHGQVVL